MSKIKKIFFKPETLIYVYFFVFTVFLAIVIQLGTAPDENYHYSFIKYYGEKSVDPFIGGQTSDFHLGPVSTEVSYLYHYIMSFVYRLFDALGTDGVLGLRIVNIFLGIGSLVGLNYIARMLRINQKIRLAVLLLIASIPMFMFLSASISYDNLIILLSVMGVALSLSIKTKFALGKVLGLVSIIFIGPIVKMAFLPISLVLGAYLLLVLYKNRKLVTHQIQRLYKNNKRLVVVYAIILFSVFLMFSAKYVSNLANYHTFQPKCAKVLTRENCLNYPIYKRSQTYNQEQAKPKTVSGDIYIVSWAKLMASRTYGLFGHKKFKEVRAISILALMAAYVFIILFFRKITQKSFKSTIIPALFIVYAAALLYTNHKSYLKRGDIALAVQGRYLFPVLLPFILFTTSLYNTTLNKKAYKYGLIGFAIVFSILTGPLYIIKGIDPTWLNYKIW